MGRLYIVVPLGHIIVTPNRIVVLTLYWYVVDGDQWRNNKWVILRQLFQIPRFVSMKGNFVTNDSFCTVRLINHPWDRIKCLASCFIKKKKISTSFILVWGKYLFLPSQYLKRIFSYFFFNINNKTDLNINEWIVLLIHVELFIYFFLYLRSIEKVCVS
jgi:hypothetical protein